MTAASAGFLPHLILWHQGESDASRTSDFRAMRAEMVTLSDRLREDVPNAQLYLFQVSRCSNKMTLDGVPAALAVFQSVAEAIPRIVLGMNTDDIGREHLWDQCHFSARGREAIVETVVPQLLSLLRTQA